MSARGGMGAHHPPAGTAATDVWLTPPDLLDALGPFDLDPCAAPAPRPWPTADRHIALPEDGLAAPWSGRVWLNPPYGRETWRWLGKLAAHGDGIALIFARTETAGFVAQAWERADALLFLSGRLTFYRPDGTIPPGTGNAGAPSVLAAYGPDNVDALELAGLPGALVTGWTTIGDGTLRLPTPHGTDR